MSVSLAQVDKMRQMAEERWLAFDIDSKLAATNTTTVVDAENKFAKYNVADKWAATLR